VGLEYYLFQFRLNWALVIAKSHAFKEKVYGDTGSWFVALPLAMVLVTPFPVIVQ
jgi:hypothetical protein